MTCILTPLSTLNQHSTSLEKQIKKVSSSQMALHYTLFLNQCHPRPQAESEWQALVALKHETATSALSQRLGGKAAQAKVEAVLAAEQLRHEQLIKLRLQNIQLKTRIHRLEARLRDGEELARDPVQVQYERLQAERLELKRQAEKQSEEALKVLRKTSGSLEVRRGPPSHSVLQEEYGYGY